MKEGVLMEALILASWEAAGLFWVEGVGFGEVVMGVAACTQTGTRWRWHSAGISFLDSFAMHPAKKGHFFFSIQYLSQLDIKIITPHFLSHFNLTLTSHQILSFRLIFLNSFLNKEFQVKKSFSDNKRSNFRIFYLFLFL